MTAEAALEIIKTRWNTDRTQDDTGLIIAGKSDMFDTWSVWEKAHIAKPKWSHTGSTKRHTMVIDHATEEEFLTYQYQKSRRSRTNYALVYGLSAPQSRGKPRQPVN